MFQDIVYFIHSYHSYIHTFIKNLKSHKDDGKYGFQSVDVTNYYIVAWTTWSGGRIVVEQTRDGLQVNSIILCDLTQGCKTYLIVTSFSFVSSNRILPFVYTFSGIFVELRKAIQRAGMC